MKFILKLFIILFASHSICMEVSNLPKKLHPKTGEAKQLYARAQELIKNGSNLNASVENNGPLLTQAALSNAYITTVQLLLSHGANPDVIDDLGKTPLLYAAEKCAHRVVRALVYFGANPNHICYQQRANKITPLHALCMPTQDSFDPKQIYSRQQAVEWLLAARANTNLPDCKGATPLFGLIAYCNKKKSTTLMPDAQKELFKNARKSLINAVLACKANLEITDHFGRKAYSQGCVDPYLSIYTPLIGTRRRKKLRAVLLQFLQGNPTKNDRISPFKKLPSDILKHILKQAYP